MFMESNRPLNRSDSVFDGAVIGAAAGGGAMYALRTDKVNNKLSDMNANNYIKNQDAATKSFGEMKNYGKRMGKDVIGGTRNMIADSSHYKDYKSAKRKTMINEKVDKGLGTIKGASGKKKAMMYAGSVIAGAIGGSMMDNRGY